MFALFGILQGYKTYITGACMIMIGVVAMVEVHLGIDVPMFAFGGSPLEMITEGFAVMTLRAGIAKVK